LHTLGTHFAACFVFSIRRLWARPCGTSIRRRTRSKQKAGVRDGKQRVVRKKRGFFREKWGIFVAKWGVFRRWTAGAGCASEGTTAALRQE